MPQEWSHERTRLSQTQKTVLGRLPQEAGRTRNYLAGILEWQEAPERAKRFNRAVGSGARAVSGGGDRLRSALGSGEAVFNKGCRRLDSAGEGVTGKPDHNHSQTETTRQRRACGYFAVRAREAGIDVSGRSKATR